MMADLNVCVGIDAGNYESKLAYSDGLGTRIIARLDGFDLNNLREESEVFFDEPVFSCVVAVPENIKINDYESSGFTNIKIISHQEALIYALDNDSKTVIYDFGDSAIRIYMIDNRKLIDNEIINDMSGKIIDIRFSEYLSERFKLDAEHEANRIKHELSEKEITLWHEIKIYREELERLIHFRVKTSARILERFCRIYHPEKIILTGGSIKIPEIFRVISELIDIKPEYRGNIIAEGASFKAKEIQKTSINEKNSVNIIARIREIKSGMIEIEDKLTRKQKDKLYSLFRQAEGMNDPGIILLMENLIREIKNA